MPSATSGSSAEVTSSQMISFGLRGQRAGDADALLLPARQLGRIAVDAKPLPSLDLVQQFLHRRSSSRRPSGRNRIPAAGR
jgi:hypothetical protein